MPEMAKLLLRVLLGVACLIASRAMLEALHLAGWSPEQILARSIMLSAEIWIWILSAILALLLWAAFDYFFYRRKLNNTTSAKNGSSKEVNIHEFLRYIGINPLDTSAYAQDRAHAALNKLRQLATNGDVKLYGKPGFKYRGFRLSWGPRELINTFYWRNAQISCVDVLGAQNTAHLSTMPDEAMGGGKSDKAVYRDLSIVRSELRRHFKKDESKLSPSSHHVGARKARRAS